jgi:U6 snRNA-associated Sm-like protein LSm7
MNMVLDDVEEVGQGEPDENGERPKRYIGLTIVRGTMLMTLSPLDGSQEIMNPFYNEDE